MKKLFIISILFILTKTVFAQQANNNIAKGNEAYKKGDLDVAIENYKSALRKEPENNTARFNLANALQRKNQTEESKKDYDEIINKTNENSLKAYANYNKALAYVKEKDLQNAVITFKEVLKEDPGNNEARENLQKAMAELKQQQQQKQPKKQQPQKQNEQKQPQFNKDMMQQKFNELKNQEKQLQKKLQAKTSNGQPDKDW